MDEDWSNDDWPDDEADEPAVIPCPQCGKEIYDDAVQCSYCGEYVTFNNRNGILPSSWWIVLGLVGAALAMLVLLINY